jgi:hypothetical protein
MIYVALSKEEVEVACEAFCFWSNRTHGRATARNSVEARTWDRLARALRAGEEIEGEFSRIDLWSGDRGRNVVFTGRVAYQDGDLILYVTNKGGVVQHVPMATSGDLSTYADFDEFRESMNFERDGAHDVAAAVADALGIEYSEELAI